MRTTVDCLLSKFQFSRLFTIAKFWISLYTNIVIVIIYKHNRYEPSSERVNSAKHGSQTHRMVDVTLRNVNPNSRTCF